MSGFQAWDASGNLVVDLGDFNTRFVSRHNVSFPTNTRIVSVSVPGITGTNSFASIMGGTVPAGGFGYYAPVTKNGGFDILYLPTFNPLYAQTLYVEVYQFN